MCSLAKLQSKWSCIARNFILLVDTKALVFVLAQPALVAYEEWFNVNILSRLSSLRQSYLRKGLVLICFHLQNLLSPQS